MNYEPENLDAPEPTNAIILNGTGAVRTHGTSVHAWIARLQHVNECGVVFDQGMQTAIRTVKSAPCYIEGEIAGCLINGSRSTDGHYVVRCEVADIPIWMSRNDCGYAIPEYEPRSIRCSQCGVVHQRHSTPCECIFLSPALILSEVQVVGLRIYRKRCDDYIKVERARLLNRVFEAVMPTTPLFSPGLNNARTEILKNSTDKELPESP